MPLKFGRILLVAVAVEALAIIVLVALVAVFGPSEPEAASAYAQRLGFWVGPIGGFVFSVVGGWLVARKQSSHHVMNGLVLGVAVAVIDVVLLVAGGSGFKLVFAVSNVGKVVAGGLGGWLAGHGHRSEG